MLRCSRMWTCRRKRVQLISHCLTNQLASCLEHQWRHSFASSRPLVHGFVPYHAGALNISSSTSSHETHARVGMWTPNLPTLQSQVTMCCRQLQCEELLTGCLVRECSRRQVVGLRLTSYKHEAPNWHFFNRTLSSLTNIIVISWAKIPTQQKDQNKLLMVE